MSNKNGQQAQQSVATGTNTNFDFPTLTARGFIGEIRKSGTGEDVKFYVTIAVPFGSKAKETRKYQYYSVYIAKHLSGLFDAAFQTQEQEGDRVVHALSSQIAHVVIESPFFEINESGYLQTSGILKSVTFGDSAS